MRLLFVCMKNVARSQIAEASFPDPVHEVMSAGINPGTLEGKTISEIGAFYVIACMSKLGYNIGRNRIKKLKPRWVEKADRIVVMAQREYWPDYLKAAESKIVSWNIPDPKDASLRKYVKVRNMILGNNKALASDLKVNLYYS